MKIAIATDGKEVSAHFGRCPEYTLVDLEKEAGDMISMIDNPGHHPGYLPQFFKKINVNAIVSGGMGQRALGLFAEQGIDVILGVTGDVAQVIERITAGNLEGGESLCKPGVGKGYGVDKSVCDHTE